MWQLHGIKDVLTQGMFMWRGMTYPAGRPGVLALPETIRELGTGSPDLKHLTTAHGLMHGTRFQRSLAQARVFTLLFLLAGASHSDLRQLRDALVRFCWPDDGVTGQLVELRFVGGSEPVFIPVLLEGGLEKTELMGFAEKIPLRFLSPDPFFRGVNWNETALTVRQSLASVNYVLERGATGVWQTLGTGTNGLVNVAKYGPDGYLYIGGAFTTANGVTVNRIAKWNGTTFEALGSGFANSVTGLAWDPAGNLYAVGWFTTGGATTYNSIAKWNGSSWSQLGPPSASGQVQTIAIGHDGVVYIGGTFTNWNGVADADYIAKWNGSSWSGVGGGMNGTVLGLAVGLNGEIYAVGSFTTAGGGSVSNAAVYDPGLGTWATTGDGLSSSGANVATSENGLIFSGSPVASSAATYGMSYYTGYQWLDLAETDAPVVRVFADGVDVYFSGVFSEVGGLALFDRIVKWNGSAFTFFDVDLPGSPSVYALDRADDGRMAVGFSTTGTVYSGAVTQIDNTGHGSAFPLLEVTGPGRIYNLINHTTGDAIYFNLEILAGETVTLDMSREIHVAADGSKTTAVTFISSWRGNILHTLLPGGNEQTFSLTPGSNYVSLFVNNSAATAEVRWRNRYPSLDGVH